jgi:hypothetical protein
MADAAFPAHPGKIVFYDGDRKIDEDRAEDVPDDVKFALNDDGAWVPVVRVVRSAMGSDADKIEEFGPKGELLRSTVRRKR